MRGDICTEGGRVITDCSCEEGTSDICNAARLERDAAESLVAGQHGREVPTSGVADIAPVEIERGRHAVLPGGVGPECEGVYVDSRTLRSCFGAAGARVSGSEWEGRWGRGGGSTEHIAEQSLLRVAGLSCLSFREGHTSRLLPARRGRRQGSTDERGARGVYVPTLQKTPMRATVLAITP